MGLRIHAHDTTGPTTVASTSDSARAFDHRRLGRVDWAEHLFAPSRQTVDAAACSISVITIVGATQSDVIETYDAVLRVLAVIARPVCRACIGGSAEFHAAPSPAA
jgi:hypothetical protein